MFTLKIHFCYTHYCQADKQGHLSVQSKREKQSLLQKDITYLLKELQGMADLYYQASGLIICIISLYK